MQIILLVLLGMLSAYREVQILVDRGSWRKEDYRNIFWYTNWKSWLKNLDSFHVSNGLFVLVMFISMGIETITWYLVPVYWFGFMQVRNVGLHIIFKRVPDWDKILKFWR